MPEKGVVQRLIRISDSTVPAFSPIVCRYRAARYASVEGYGETQQEAHPTEPIPDHELGASIAEVVLGLQDQDLEHGNRIKRRPATLAAVTVTKPLDQPRPEILEIHRPLQNLQRIAMLAKGFKVIVQAEKRMRVHDDAP